MAHGRDGFQGHVARLLDRPFVVLLVQEGADQAGDGSRVLSGAVEPEYGGAIIRPPRRPGKDIYAFFRVRVLPICYLA